MNGQEDGFENTGGSENVKISFELPELFETGIHAPAKQVSWKYAQSQRAAAKKNLICQWISLLCDHAKVDEAKLQPVIHRGGVSKNDTCDGHTLSIF